MQEVTTDGSYDALSEGSYVSNAEGALVDISIRFILGIDVDSRKGLLLGVRVGDIVEDFKLGLEVGCEVSSDFNVGNDVG